MASRFEKILPFPRQGNCIPSAAIRWPDFGDRPSFGRPFVQIFRHSDAPLLSFSPRRRFPRPTPERVFVAIHRSAAGFPKQVPGHDEFGLPEGYVAAVAEDFGPDLYQHLWLRGQRPVLHFLRQTEGHDMMLWTAPTIGITMRQDLVGFVGY